MLVNVDNWDLRDHRQQATRVQNRRNVQVGSRKNQTKPRTGTDGFLHHAFTVTASSGIRNRDVRVPEIVVRDLEKATPDKWGCVQARELWSPQEDRQVRPGHLWLKFGKVPGSKSCVEKKFKLGTRKYEEYKGCLLYTSPSPRDGLLSRMPSSA